MKKQVWHSRLPDRREDEVFERMNSSISFDIRLFREEIAATRAHASQLHRAGVYSDEELKDAGAALGRIEEEIAAGELDWEEFEDIHSLVESRLTELVPAAGLKIQTGRSRNEQTATAQRLFMKKALGSVAQAVCSLQAALVEKAEETVDVLMPGYTHCRPAQPSRLAHYLLGLFFGLERDKARIGDARDRLDSSPAGSAAFAGSAFPLDRAALAEELGFSRVMENCLDAVSDRDGQMEALAALAILMVRLSRFSEDFVYWSAPAYGFLEISDTYCTSSSLMPQKKNPDSLELVRGKAGRVISDLVAVLVTCKGLPTGYQKDLQEDKEPLFDALETVLASLAVSAGVIKNLRINKERMESAITRECLATDRAEKMVQRGLSFRDAFATVAGDFASTATNKAPEHDQSRVSPAAALSAAQSVEERDVTGGVSRRAVRDQVRKARALLDS